MQAFPSNKKRRSKFSSQFLGFIANLELGVSSQILNTNSLSAALLRWFFLLFAGIGSSSSERRQLWLLFLSLESGFANLQKMWWMLGIALKSQFQTEFGKTSFANIQNLSQKRSFTSKATMMQNPLTITLCHTLQFLGSEAHRLQTSQEYSKHEYE